MPNGTKPFKKENINMFNKSKRIIAALMAMALVFSLAGCKKSDEEMSSGGIVYVDNDVYVDGDGNATTDGQGGTGGQGGQGGTGGSTVNPNQTTKTGVNPADYKGTTVVFATTILSKEDESGPVVKNFEKEYDITVEEKLVGDIITEVGGMIASGQNVDCMRSNGDFPAIMSIMQSLTAAKLDYTDTIWDQYMFNTTTFGGEPYLCNTVGNIWNEGVMILYSKSLLKRAGATTPEEYDKAGKWTWDAFTAIAKAVSKLDGAYGCYFEPDYVLGTVGTGVYKYDNGKYTNGLTDTRFVETMTRMAQWRKDGFVTDSALHQFSSGVVGICPALGWALKKNGSNAKANWNDIGFYYAPSYKEGEKPYLTGMLKGWGLARGSSNPVAAGLFLRYYLDVNNYSTKSAFISDEAEKFFFEFTNTASDRYAGYTPFYTYGSPNKNNDTITGGAFAKWDAWHISFGDPSQVASSLSSLSTAVDKAVGNINSHVAKNTGLK